MTPHRSWQSGEQEGTPSAFWQLFLEKKLEKVLRREIARHRRVRVDDTAIVLPVNDHTQRNHHREVASHVVNTVLSRK
jgi:hypothetical protein